MDEKYTLKYIPDAKTFTDPMKDHENLMNQRRRWINSSLFAFLYVWKTTISMQWILGTTSSGNTLLLIFL